MSKFEVKVIKIDAVEPIEGADAIELARVADYRSVVRKGDFKAGDLAVYIPEASVLPEWLLKEMNLEGKLSGSNKNRVKAVKLRGCLSQGLLYPAHVDHGPGVHIHLEVGIHLVEEGSEVAEFLGIAKYEPPIPTSMSGEVSNIGSENTIKYDIENIKKHPNIFVEGEEIWASEKAHGTFCGIGYIPYLNNSELFERGDVFTFSKGLGGQGLVFKNNKNNDANAYVQNIRSLTENKSWFNRLNDAGYNVDEPIFVLGEIFGSGVQDLSYGFTDKQFRVFDVHIGKNNYGRYLNFEELKTFCDRTGLKMVDVIYHGPYNKKVIEQHSTGKTVTGNGSHIREGVVVKPVIERRDNDLGRVFLKSINPDYLLRKGNVTEFQ